MFQLVQLVLRKKKIDRNTDIEIFSKIDILKDGHLFQMLMIVQRYFSVFWQMDPGLVVEPFMAVSLFQFHPQLEVTKAEWKTALFHYDHHPK